MLANVNTVIPIQGTFDIARGRNSLRTHIAAHHWPTTFNMRAGALLTCIGEMILTVSPGHLIPLQVEMSSKDANVCLRMQCEIPRVRLDENRLFTLQDRIRKMSDDLSFDYQQMTLRIEAKLHLHG